MGPTIATDTSPSPAGIRRSEAIAKSEGLGAKCEPASDRLSFLDASTGGVRIAHELYAAPETDPADLPAVWAFPLDEEQRGYVVDDRLVAAPEPPDAQLQATTDGRHALPLQEVGVPVYRSFEEAAARAPEALGAELLRRLDARRRQGAR